MLAEQLLKQQVYGNHACTTPAESAGDGDEVYGYVCNLRIHSYGRLHNNGAGASGAGSTVVDSIIVDGKATNIAIQLTPSHADSAGVVQAWLPYICCFGKCSASMVAILLLIQLCQHGGRTPAVSAGVPPGGG